MEAFHTDPRQSNTFSFTHRHDHAVLPRRNKSALVSAAALVVVSAAFVVVAVGLLWCRVGGFLLSSRLVLVRTTVEIFFDLGPF